MENHHHFHQNLYHHHQNLYHHRHHRNLSVKMEKFPRDLLQGFIVPSGGSDDNSPTRLQNQREEQHEEEEDEVELNLGLSLGGRFGVDKNAKKNKLMRSSSIVGTMPLLREDDAVTPPPAVFPSLMRTSSLPTETEEEWRKRKELQTLRRMEAKRRRSEKRGSKSEREIAGSGAGEEVGGTAGPPPFGLPSWAVGTRQVVLGDVLGKGNVGGVGFQGLFAQPSSQGSADSQGGSSSSVSEMESKSFLGSSSCGEARSPASNQSTQERSSQEPIGSSGTKPDENISRTSKAEMENPSRKKPQIMGREIGTNLMEDMPCVFTKGDGPNGRRIEGILYKYGKGEEVRIMCVCHGNFLSPAEFVKHAGGGDVAHPLRHIVVNPSASPL